MVSLSTVLSGLVDTDGQAVYDGSKFQLWFTSMLDPSPQMWTEYLAILEQCTNPFVLRPSGTAM
jgi:hypothetical protein